jgi:hypothetical protein
MPIPLNFLPPHLLIQKYRRASAEQSHDKSAHAFYFIRCIVKLSFSATQRDVWIPGNWTSNMKGVLHCPSYKLPKEFTDRDGKGQFKERGIGHPYSH